MEREPVLISIREAARISGWPRERLYELAHARQLPGFWDLSGKRPRFRVHRLKFLQMLDGLADRRGVVQSGQGQQPRPSLLPPWGGKRRSRNIPEKRGSRLLVAKARHAKTVRDGPLHLLRGWDSNPRPTG